jgi:protein-tyrosine-phosphatase/predicted ATP-grasp superfamily ATP-dependent carboligase
MTTIPRPSVLVVGDNQFAALQVVRSLGRAGLPVELVAYSPEPITRRSKYVSKCYPFPHPLLEPDTFGERLLALIRSRRFELVIPTSDEALAILMNLRDEVLPYARVAAPDARGFAATSHKDQTIELARKVGIPTPATRLLHSQHQIEELASWWSFPLVLKPVCSISPGTARRNEVKLAHHPDQARQLLADMLAHGPVLAQQYCRGRGVGLCILADHGRLVATFQHRRLHEPPAGGASSYRVSEPVDDQLREYAERFCEYLAWTGVAMFEYRHDHVNGRFTLMEVNGRLWGSLALAIQAGVNFPWLLYQLLVHGHVPPSRPYRVPRFTRHTTRDAYWLQANLRAPSDRDDIIKVPARDLLKELGNLACLREGYDLESLSDPLPGMTAWLCLGRQIAADVSEKLCQFRLRRRFQRAVRSARRQWQTSGSGPVPATSVLFVCTGNVNRSAVAQWRLVTLARQAGLEFRIASAGVTAEPGTLPSEISRDVAREVGVELASHRSSRLTRQMLLQFDRVVVMDAGHLGAVHRLAPQIAENTIALSAFDTSGDPTEILDPYGQDREFFRMTYRRIVRCVDQFAARCCQIVPQPATVASPPRISAIAGMEGSCL